MSENKSEIKILLGNFFWLVSVAYDLYKKGICDKPIKGALKYVETCETKGYCKEEASMLLNLSIRQFDRRVKLGLIKKGRKYRDDPRLYWDMDYIKSLSAALKK